MQHNNPILDYLRTQILGTEFENNVFVAGGFVRDLVLGRESKDIDLVVTVEDGGIAFAEWITERMGCRTPGNPVIFPRFGTAKFNLRHPDLPDIDIEAVMPRSEVYTEGSRKPDVGYTLSLKEDAKRRDFTFNSLYLDVTSGQILDYTQGQLAIKHGLITTAIDPNIIFTDDPLRMLRAIRFAVKFGWVIDGKLATAIETNARNITMISQERIRDEVSKMLVTDNPALAILRLHVYGLLPYVLPAIHDLLGVGQNDYHMEDVFNHTLTVLSKTPPDLITRLTALFHDSGKPLTRTVDENGKVHFYTHDDVGESIVEVSLTRLRYPRNVIDAVKIGVRNHMRLKGSGDNGEVISDKALRKLRVDLGEHLPMILDVMDADNQSHSEGHCMPDQITGIRARLAVLAEAEPARVVLPINGDDVMRLLQIGPGREVGRRLALVKDVYFENPQLTVLEAEQIVLNG